MEDKDPYGKSIFALELMKHIEKVFKENHHKNKTGGTKKWY